MIKIDVWLTFSDGEASRCGEIVCTNPDERGRIDGAFRYAAGYLDHPRSFPLDPARLPLSEGEFRAERPCGVHAVFEDSLPDDWGRRLLIRKAGLSRPEQTVPMMLAAIGNTGLGALAYQAAGRTSADDGSAGPLQLASLVEAAMAFDAGEALSPPELNLLFKAASSPGGARPKALVTDDAGVQWIAKFPSTRDRMDMIALEAACLALAGKAGLAVPEFRVDRVGRRKVLRVRRFDVTPAGGRRHMVSAQTLLGAEGYYVAGYPDLVDLARKYSGKPSVDIPRLFRQMVFNAAVGNTDDHLKNFMMLHDARGYRISPAYDLTPDTSNRREHFLYFGLDHRCPRRSVVEKLGRRFGVSDGRGVVDEVISAVRDHWANSFRRYEVPAKDAGRIGESISARLEKLA